MATLVERHSRFVTLVGLPTRHTADVVAVALVAKIAELPDQPDGPSPGIKARRWRSTAGFTVAERCAGVIVRPAQPMAARHQREHQRPAAPIPPTQLRFAERSQAGLDEIAAELNGRRRQTLGWKSPSQALDLVLR